MVRHFFQGNKTLLNFASILKTFEAKNSMHDGYSDRNYYYDLIICSTLLGSAYGVNIACLTHTTNFVTNFIENGHNCYYDLIIFTALLGSAYSVNIACLTHATDYVTIFIENNHVKQFLFIKKNIFALVSKIIKTIVTKTKNNIFALGDDFLTFIKTKTKIYKFLQFIRTKTKIYDFLQIIFESITNKSTKTIEPNKNIETTEFVIERVESTELDKPNELVGSEDLLNRTNKLLNSNNSTILYSIVKSGCYGTFYGFMVGINLTFVPMITSHILLHTIYSIM